ncbi:MAG: SAM-dependent methyltransferase [uncultured Acidimicrobiales bacterium]|uniref:SAM-dependent methyltransferase n=1 Tax=uncultured Acidimicrobiales bacterium TaxID=310071 RepID=A0A6J4IFU9_9ACTN|nr:MAG: SAM-dependent methyltransferase [uncultured Acidimicrobiales bacterium]
MLTVDYDRLGVGAGERLLDLGAGAGRHAFGAMRRGAAVVALDLDQASLKEARLMLESLDGDGAAANGSALALPFPDGSFDRVIASEVMEHIDDDRGALREIARVLRPGGTVAVTVPRWFPELVCWAISDDYHAPNQPGGHVRIYREGVLSGRITAAGLTPYDRHHAHGLHSPYWWLKCAVGVANDANPLVRGYHQLLVWDITKRPLPLQVAERVLQPVIGKSLVVYGRKPLEADR